MVPSRSPKLVDAIYLFMTKDQNLMARIAEVVSTFRGMMAINYLDKLRRTKGTFPWVPPS